MDKDARETFCPEIDKAVTTLHEHSKGHLFREMLVEHLCRLATEFEALERRMGV